MEKIEALAKHLGVEIEEIEQQCEDEFHCGGEIYMVYTDEEANLACEEYIRETLWAFNSSFLVNYMPRELTSKNIDDMRGDRCESINEAFLALVGDNFDDLVDAAIGCDGRGHFLSSYDGHEYEEGEYFIYHA